MTVVTPFGLTGPPLFSPLLIPALPSLTLTDAERELIAWLQMRSFRQRQYMDLTRAYYRGEQIITSLGIAIPKQLEGLRTLVGWGAKAVDPYVDRLSVDSFRLAGATDSDEDLYDLWVANGLDADQSLAYTDALSMGRAYTSVGSGQAKGDPPVICVESPLNMIVSWDLRSLTPKAALQSYFLDEQRHAALYLPDQTIHLGADELGQWEITDRDMHGFGFVPVQRMANRPTTDNRDGASEIDPILMSMIDQACRTLVNLAVASELYSVPQKYILGATEADFQNPDGTQKSGWDTYITKVLGIERDDDGELPTVGQFQPYDPATYTKVIDELAAQASSHLGMPPQEMGVYTQGNPASADAVEYQLDPRNKKAIRKQKTFGRSWIQTMQMAMRFQNKGVLPAEFEKMSVDWDAVSAPQPAATADALVKLESMGAIPGTSDVTLKRAGFNSVERAQLAQDRKTDIAETDLAELTNSIQIAQARKGLAVATDVAAATAPAPKPASPPGYTPPTVPPANGGQ